MKDENRDYKSTVHHNAYIEDHLERAEKRTGRFRSHIISDCIVWKIRRDTAPQWKQLVMRIIGL